MSSRNMLKIDETYTDSKVRWNLHDNKIYGLCYEHAREQDLTFNDIENIEKLSEQFTNSQVHIPKESMVIAVASNCSNTKTQLLAALPTCTKSEVTYQANLLEKLAENHFQKNGAPFLNYCTDRDPSRRQIFNSLMCHKVKPDSAIYQITSKLRLIDKEFWS